MLERLRRCDALLRVKCHHLLHEINGLLTRIGYQLAQRGRHKLGEGKADLGGELVTLGPLGLRRTSQHCTRFVDLIRLVVARKQRSHQVQLCHDGAQREDVDRAVIIG